MKVRTRRLAIALGIVVVFLVATLIVSKVQNQQKSVSLNIKDEAISVSLYPNAKVTATTTDPNEGQTYIGTRFSVTQETNDSVPKATQWYLDSLKNQGWIIDVPLGNPTSDIQYVSLHNDKYTLRLSVFKNTETGKTNVVTEYQTKNSDVYEPGEETER